MTTERWRQCHPMYNFFILIVVSLLATLAREKHIIDTAALRIAANTGSACILDLWLWPFNHVILRMRHILCVTLSLSLKTELWRILCLSFVEVRWR